MTVPEVPQSVVPLVSVDVERHDETVVIAVGGEVDLLTAPQVEQAIFRALDQQPAVLVIDLLGVTFLASAGLAALMKAHEKAASVTQLRVVAAGSATLRPLEVTGLDKPLSVFTSRDEALRA
jgi:anti-sigma B factor antagonist